MTSIYTSTANEQLPRILTLLDRNPASSTFGCFDRNYWHYKITDFPCMRMQEASLTLALAAKTKQTIKKELLIRLANAGLEFWAKNIAADGSASEWYPDEKSYVATAFSTYAAAETAAETGNQKDFVIDALKKSTSWLAKRTEHRVQNQQSGAISAILYANKILKDEKLSKAASQLIQDLISRQTEEGWFTEYGGADIGYLSLTVDYLAKASLISEDSQKLEKSAIKACEFVKCFLHPNFTTGGEYGSRNTEYLIPHGFEILRKKSNSSSAISSFIKEALKRKTIAGPWSLDERYLAYNLYTYFQAGMIDSEDESAQKPVLTDKSFENAKIFIRSKKSHQIIINCQKGGAFTIFDKDGQHMDSGVRLNTEEGMLTSGYLDPKTKSSNLVKDTTEEFTIEGRFIRIKPNLMTPTKQVGLRAFQLTAGKYAPISKIVKEKLRDKLITSAKTSKYSYKRTIIIEDEKIMVNDTIKPANDIKEVILGTKASEQFIPSAKFWTESDNQNFSTFAITKKKDSFSITRTFSKEYEETVQ